MKAVVFRGFKYGLGAFIITTLLETAYDKMYPDTHGHGSAHHWGMNINLSDVLLFCQNISVIKISVS